MAAIPPESVYYKSDIVTLLKLKDVRALDRLVRAGRFPHGRELHGNRVFWTADDLRAYFVLAGRLYVEPDEENAAGSQPPLKGKKSAQECDETQ